MYPFDDIVDNFPPSFPSLRQVQRDAFTFIAANERGVVLEIPTGEGKTAIGVTCAKTESMTGTGPSFYITPGKAQVGQIAETVGEDAIVITGRSDYECLYYTDRGRPDINAQQSPCYMLKCPHRVNQETGETEDPTATPCTYFYAKWEALRRARDGGAVVTTTAWWLMNRMLVDGWRDLDPQLVIIDEVHRVAGIARAIFEQRITDHHLFRAVEMLKDVQPEEAAKLEAFAQSMYQKARKHPSVAPSLLQENEIHELISVLDTLKPVEIERSVRAKIVSGELNVLEDRETIKVLESLAHGIPRMVRNLRYAVSKTKGDGGIEKPLAYVVAYYFTEEDTEAEGGQRKSRTVFEFKSYYVRGLVQKAIGNAKVVAMSATIGDPQVLSFETGIDLPFKQFGSTFAAKNTRVYLPTDTPNLAHKMAGRDDWKNALQSIVAAAKRFTAEGHRCLVVVTSEKERAYFLGRAERDGLNAVVSYRKGLTARAAANTFKSGEGMVLVGTSAVYAEGVDLPDGLAPVTFMLRPGFASPDDPMSQFEERRFGNPNGRNSKLYALRMHRVMVEAQQVRGRNVRGPTDVGVTFFISQAFRGFLKAAMPKWLEPSYRGNLTFEDGVTDALKLLPKPKTTPEAK